MILLTMPVFLSTNYEKNTLLSHIVAKLKGFTAIFKIVTKNIAYMHHEHNVWANIEVNVFSEHRLNITSLKGTKDKVKQAQSRPEVPPARLLAAYKIGFI